MLLNMLFESFKSGDAADLRIERTGDALVATLIPIVKGVSPDEKDNSLRTLNAALAQPIRLTLRESDKDAEFAAALHTYNEHRTTVASAIDAHKAAIDAAIKSAQGTSASSVKAAAASKQKVVTRNKPASKPKARAKTPTKPAAAKKPTPKAAPAPKKSPAVASVKSDARSKAQPASPPVAKIDHAPIAAQSTRPEGDGLPTRVLKFLQEQTAPVGMDAVAAAFPEVKRKQLLKAVDYQVGRKRVVKHGEGRGATYITTTSSTPAATPAADNQLALEI